MTLDYILDGAELLACSGTAQVTGVAYDSRCVRLGDLFVAMKGGTTDGNRYIDAAIRAGAVAVVTDAPEEKPRPTVAWAVVPHGRRALARLSANFFHRPAERLVLTGITGTNGKTTTAFLIESILAAAGRQSALLGTIEYRIAGRSIPAPHTTPEALEIHQVLAEACAAGATEAVMEVSSHALAQERVFGLPFQVAVFTNLTRDHLDFHHDLDDYFAAKRRLFEGCGAEPPQLAVVNLGDAYGRELARFCRGLSQVVTYAAEEGSGPAHTHTAASSPVAKKADFFAEHVVIAPSGTRFDLATPDGILPLFSPLIGRVNVENILAAAAAAWARGCPPGAIAEGVAALRNVPGRFEKVDLGQNFTVVVDYAHTDDALRNLTALAREFVARTRGRVITVFGCGGDRDRSKRPLMGEAAGRGSDLVVLTSDNPRSEDPITIINDVLPGLQRAGAKYLLEPDRRRAIALAIDEARAGDIVLLAGKGHEKVQTSRTGSVPFDDVEEARAALRSVGYNDVSGPGVSQ
jgi:UDP-N-acetylmuramoyl-L-alanyl-D-glutamate--2,6-diaminopimelate ligase